MALGERSPLAVLNAPASGRMAVAEAITNIAAAAIDGIGKIRLSANWMAATGHPGEDANLFDTVKAVGDELCRDLGVAIPVGKDSLSLRTRWQEGKTEYQVVAPVSLVVTAFAPVTDVRRHLTPQLKSLDEPSYLLLLDLGQVVLGVMPTKERLEALPGRDADGLPNGSPRRARHRIFGGPPATPPSGAILREWMSYR